VTVDGKPLPQAQAPRLWRYHKPKGLVTSHKDPQGRKTVFEALPPGLPRVVSVGRLDLNTEGLLLLTTDGELARHLELPSTAWLRRYRVRAHGKVTERDLDKVRQGLTLDGVHYGPVEPRLDREQGGNIWLTLGLREGKNREVKRLLEALGLTVNRHPHLLRAVCARRTQSGRGERGEAARARRAARHETIKRAWSRYTGSAPQVEVGEAMKPCAS
jgi:23S rRNA pseudouridine2605 synthase